MSQHPSLRGFDKNKKHRSVLKRYERISLLKEKEKWTEDSGCSYSKADENCGAYQYEWQDYQQRFTRVV